MKATHKERLQGIEDCAVASARPIKKIPAWVRRAVIALEMDIEDRRGIKWEWNLVDDDEKVEIRKTWATIIANAAAQEDKSQ